MSTVMGLSLTADAVGWVLVDVAEGTVLDHDVLEVTVGAGGAETAGAAALGAHAIAATTGHEIDCVRITWSDDAAHDGLRLQSRLRSLALSRTEAVPRSCATAVPVKPQDAEMPSDIALAYGAALATVVPAEAITEPVAQRPPRRVRPRRLMTSALGVAAAVALGVFFLGAAGGPDIAPAATTAERPTSSEPGWVAVPAAPSNSADTPIRKVVAVPSPPDTVLSGDTPTDDPSQAVAAAAEAVPEAAPAVVAEPEGSPQPSAFEPATVPQLGAPEPATVPHLDAPEPATIPHLGAPEPATVPHAADPLAPHAPGPQVAAPDVASSPEMTDPVNLFTALP